jgi:hypothetical protein
MRQQTLTYFCKATSIYYLVRAQQETNSFYFFPKVQHMIQFFKQHRDKSAFYFVANLSSLELRLAICMFFRLNFLCSADSLKRKTLSAPEVEAHP